VTHQVVPAVLALTSTHDALLTELAEARAARTGEDVERARRAVEIDALRAGIEELQELERRES
jgi:hypothetical protein